jgi:thiosulfate reductase cytochrome b subunit
MRSSATLPSTARPALAPVHPAWLRATHWLNVVAVAVMVASGWRIYDAAPFWPLRFPSEWTLGGWLGGALRWHFAGMWLLAVNGLVYLAVNLASGRLVRKYLPLRLADLRRDAAAALRGRLAHADPQHYNALQKLAYLGVVLDLVLLVLSGLVLWKSVQFPLLRELLGGYEPARRVHFVAMGLLLGFVAVHVVMVAIVPRTLLAMLRGR